MNEIVKFAVLSISVLFFFTPDANARPDATKMTCVRAEATVRKAGVVVMSTGKWTYDMFYSKQKGCPSGQQRRPAWVPTLDVAQCFVGYTCEDVDRN